MGTVVVGVVAKVAMVAVTAGKGAKVEAEMEPVATGLVVWAAVARGGREVVGTMGAREARVGRAATSVEAAVAVARAVARAARCRS